MTSFVKTWVDALVIGLMLVGYFYILWAMIRRKWKSKATIMWGGFGALFFLLEFYGAPTGDTLSQTLIELFGWVNVSIGTVIFALVLLLHWPDLARQIGAFRRNVAMALLNFTDDHFESMPVVICEAIDNIAIRFDPTVQEELRKQAFGDLYDEDPVKMLKNLNDDLEKKLREYANDKH